MNCTNHPETSAQGMCTKCGKVFCEECLVDVGGAYQCKNCLKNPNQNHNSYHENNYGTLNGIPYQESDSQPKDTGKMVLWIMLMLFFPFVGIFAGKAKPFGKTGNLICKVIGWVYTVSLAIVLFFTIVLGAFATTVSTTGISNAIEEVEKVAEEPVVPTERFEVLEFGEDSDGTLRYITGKIKNNDDKTMGYMQVQISLYDKDENVIGSALDNVNNIGPGEVWSFKAIVLDDTDLASYKISDITGF